MSAFMEGFWGYLCYTIAHRGVSPRENGEWIASKFRGLKEFVDHIVSVVGTDQLKPTTECRRGVATLGNTPYDHAASEASPSFKIGLSESTVAVGDLIVMLLGTSFAPKGGDD